MNRISFSVKGRESSEIFEELSRLFKREDYSAATTGFEYKNGYDNLDGYTYNGKPREVIILDYTGSVTTFLILKKEKYLKLGKVILKDMIVVELL